MFLLKLNLWCCFTAVTHSDALKSSALNFRELSVNTNFRGATHLRISGLAVGQSVAGKLDDGLLEVVCVGYTLFANNQDTLAKYHWLLVVFDEVHSFKNPKTNRYSKGQTNRYGRRNVEYLRWFRAMSSVAAERSGGGGGRRVSGQCNRCPCVT